MPTPRVPRRPKPASTASHKVEIHYVVSSHWDREWYLPFQGFRYKLVKMLDTLMSILESDPRFTCFVMDGQTAPILDYLEIKPENRARMEALIRAGRIHVGPWYTMPDERIISGEGMVRNLLRGFAESRRLGVEPMRYGYICDIFGHCAQMPQIFAGMGIPYAYVWRGTNDSTHPPHFYWESPDGSRVLTHRARDDDGYATAAPVRNAAAGPDPGSKEWRKSVLEAGRTLRRNDDARATLPVYLFLEGHDHNVPTSALPDALDVLREDMPDARIIHSNLLAFAKAVEARKARLPVFKGELVAPAKDPARWSAVIQHCQSSYYPMKQANDASETLLTRWAEPLLIWAALAGTAAPTANFLDHAWLHLLQNQPHDSIGGCSIPQVHKDTEYRYDQARAIAREVVDDCRKLLSPPAGKPDAKSLCVSVFSGSPVAQDRVVTLEADYPADFPAVQLYGFSDDVIPCFDLLDERGRRIEYQLHSYMKDFSELWKSSLISGLRGFYRARFSARLAHDGIGVRNLRMVPRELPYRSMGSQLTGPHRAENEHLAVQVESTGAVTITDKATGRTFGDLCVFEDGGDVGDGWYFIAPRNDQKFLSDGFPTGISVLTDGPLVTTFRIEKTMMLPDQNDWMQRRRGAGRKAVALTLDVTLRQGERAIECAARLENTVKDHRLRVLLPTTIAGNDYFANQAFTFLRRPRGADPATFDWRECDAEERDFQGVVGVDDRAGGLAILAGEGLHEVAVKNDGTIALTLMRSFGQTTLPASEPRSQLLQTMDFRWQIVPFAGRPDMAGLWQAMAAWRAGLQVNVGRGDGGEPATFARLRQGTAVLSALKPADDRDGLIVRVFNPTSKAVRDALEFAFPFATAVEVNHAEEALPSVAPVRRGRVLPLNLPPHKIRTYRLRYI